MTETEKSLREIFRKLNADHAQQISVIRQGSPDVASEEASCLPARIVRILVPHDFTFKAHLPVAPDAGRLPPRQQSASLHS